MAAPSQRSAVTSSLFTCTFRTPKSVALRALELPEILMIIFDDLLCRGEFRALGSAARVNRLWNWIAIPRLWKFPRIQALQILCTLPKNRREMYARLIEAVQSFNDRMRGTAEKAVKEIHLPNLKRLDPHLANVIAVPSGIGTKVEILELVSGKEHLPSVDPNLCRQKLRSQIELISSQPRLRTLVLIVQHFLRGCCWNHLGDLLLELVPQLPSLASVRFELSVESRYYFRPNTRFDDFVKYLIEQRKLTSFDDSICPVGAHYCTIESGQWSERFFRLQCPAPKKLHQTWSNDAEAQRIRPWVGDASTYFCLPQAQELQSLTIDAWLTSRQTPLDVRGVEEVSRLQNLQALDLWISGEERMGTALLKDMMLPISRLRRLTTLSIMIDYSYEADLFISRRRPFIYPDVLWSDDPVKAIMVLLPQLERFTLLDFSVCGKYEIKPSTLVDLGRSCRYLRSLYVSAPQFGSAFVQSIDDGWEDQEPLYPCIESFGVFITRNASRMTEQARQDERRASERTWKSLAPKLRSVTLNSSDNCCDSRWQSESGTEPRLSREQIAAIQKYHEMLLWQKQDTRLEEPKLAKES